MKYTLFLMIILAGYSQASSQIVPVIAATQLNTLYRGVDNPISIAVPEWPCSRLHVTITDGTISGSGCTYVVRAGKQPQAWIMVVGIDGADTTNFGEYALRVLNPPKPVPYFAGFTGTKNLIDNNVLLAGRGIISRLVDFNFDLLLRINSFDMVVTTTDGRTTTLHATDARITEVMKSTLQELKQGDTVHLINIVSGGPDGVELHLEPIELELK